MQSQAQQTTQEFAVGQNLPREPAKPLSGSACCEDTMSWSPTWLLILWMPMASSSPPSRPAVAPLKGLAEQAAGVAKVPPLQLLLHDTRPGEPWLGARAEAAVTKLRGPNRNTGNILGPVASQAFKVSLPVLSLSGSSFLIFLSAWDKKEARRALNSCFVSSSSVLSCLRKVV